MFILVQHILKIHAYFFIIHLPHTFCSLPFPIKAMLKSKVVTPTQDLGMEERKNPTLEFYLCLVYHLFVWQDMLGHSPIATFLWEGLEAGGRSPQMPECPLAALLIIFFHYWFPVWVQALLSLFSTQACKC